MTGPITQHEGAQPTPPPPSVPDRVRTAYGQPRPTAPDRALGPDTPEGGAAHADRGQTDPARRVAGEIETPIYGRRGDRPVLGHSAADRVGRSLDLRA